MQYGLNKETVNKIIKVFSKYQEVEEALLYGSRAKGLFKPGSDIDLALKGGNLNLHVLNRINLDLDDLLLPYTFDISLYHQISNPDLVEHIESGVVFYQRQSKETKGQT